MLIYLASPYSKYPDGRQTAYELACKKAAQLMMAGHEVFCPIAHSHPIQEIGGIPDEFATHDFWLKQDFAVLKNCDWLYVYMMPGWTDSHGVKAEIEFAEKHRIPVAYLAYEPEYATYDTEGFGL